MFIRLHTRVQTEGAMRGMNSASPVVDRWGHPELLSNTATTAKAELTRTEIVARMTVENSAVRRPGAQSMQHRKRTTRGVFKGAT